MIELINGLVLGRHFRKQLLATASLTAIACSLIANASVFAEEGENARPTVWIELGGQLSEQVDGQETFAPALMDARSPTFSSPQPLEHLPRVSLDEYGKFSFAPRTTDLVFSASVRYGRSTSKKKGHQQTNPNPFVKYYYTYNGPKHLTHITAVPGAAKFSDVSAQSSEQHLVLDFQAGKDVGLGLFGRGDGSSIISAGVRFAQFVSRRNISLKSDPDWHFQYKYLPSPAYFGFLTSKFAPRNVYHSNRASIREAQSFHGIGPSLSLSGTMPIMGRQAESSVSLDWGMNAAVLFGKQRTKVEHQTTGNYHSASNLQGSRVVVYHPTPKDISRSKSIVVPNVGVLAGLSFRYSNAKLSFGYRADFFFGAMDGGIDTRKSYDRDFYGPYATISIGLGSD